MGKIWTERHLCVKTEQLVKIQPTPDMGGITLSFEDLDGEHKSGLLYISIDEVRELCNQLTEMSEKYK